MIHKRVYPLSLVAAALAVAQLAAAHTGVQNQAVLARMNAMSAISDEMEILVPMARGAMPFDAVQAQTALRRLEDLAARTPDLFRAPESDPQSEALPAIWEDFADFETRARELASIADAAAARVADPATLRAAVARIGSNCSACHDRYREER